MNNPAVMAHHARGPHIPSQEVLNKLDAPLVRTRSLPLAILLMYDRPSVEPRGAQEAVRGAEQVATYSAMIYSEIVRKTAIM